MPSEPRRSEAFKLLYEFARERGVLTEQEDENDGDDRRRDL